MAAPICISLVAHVTHQLIALYCVGQTGMAATAGVNAASNLVLVVAALTQVLSVGSAAQISQAMGRRDLAGANLLFNQSMLLSVVCAIVMLALVSSLMHQYLRIVAADMAVQQAGSTFMHWVLPGYALMLPMAVMASSLRASGTVGPVMGLYALTLVVNAILAPVFISGSGTGVPMGVKGAGLATSISVAVGVLACAGYINRVRPCIAPDWRLMRPLYRAWWRMLIIGLPAGVDLGLYCTYISMVLYAIRDFGSSAQAGFGIGSQVLQAVLLPTASVALAVGPIAGQNLGAKRDDRVRATFRTAAGIGAMITIMSTVLVQCWPMALFRFFDVDAAAANVAMVFLQLTSWSLLAQSLVSTCTGMFQGFGNTVPSMISTFVRLVMFSFSVLWLAGSGGFRIEIVWYLWAASLTLQAVVSLCLLRLEFKRRLLPTFGQVVEQPP